jgi:small subunit ribosomal protein S20
MATHKSAEKRARQTLRRNKINRARRANILTAVKALDAAIASKNKPAIVKAQRAAESALARGVSRGTLHWKTASRRISRLSKRVKKTAGK